MTIPFRVRHVVALTAAALALGFGALAAAPAQANSATHTHVLTAPAAHSATAIPDGAYNNCPSGYFCSFWGTDGNDGYCLQAWTDQPPYNFSLNTPYNCPTESLANRTPYIVRLYFGGHQNQDWVCIPSGVYINDTSVDEFNNGSHNVSDGWHVTLWDEAGSGQIGTGTCSNGLHSS